MVVVIYFTSNDKTKTSKRDMNIAEFIQGFYGLVEQPEQKIHGYGLTMKSFGENLTGLIQFWNGI